MTVRKRKTEYLNDRETDVTVKLQGADEFKYLGSANTREVKQRALHRKYSKKYTTGLMSGDLSS